MFFRPQNELLLQLLKFYYFSLVSLKFVLWVWRRACDVMVAFANSRWRFDCLIGHTLCRHQSLFHTTERLIPALGIVPLISAVSRRCNFCSATPLATAAAVVPYRASSRVLKSRLRSLRSCL